MENIKVKIKDLKTSINDFLLMLNLDRSKNTLNVIKKYDQVFESLAEITDTTDPEKDLSTLLKLLSGLEEMVAKIQESRIDEEIRQPIVQKFKEACNRLATFSRSYRIDDKLSGVVGQLRKDLEALATTRKELLSQRDRLVDLLQDNPVAAEAFLDELLKLLPGTIAEIKGSEEFTRLLYVGFVAESIHKLEGQKVQDLSVRVEKFLARIVLTAIKDMSTQTDYVAVIKNVKVILNQLPSRIATLVDSALPPKWKSSLVFEEPVSFTTAMQEKFTTNVQGIIIKNVATAEGPQAEMQKLLTNIKDQSLTRRDLISMLRSQNRGFAKELLSLLGESDRQAVEGVIEQTDQSAVRLVKRK